jgi:pSer/pThr/pTyr-binding forkhead associated (FHA) protein
MTARLVSYKGDRRDLAFPIATGTTTGIGRDPGNLIQLQDPEVSRRHAVVRELDNQWVIEDLESKNGILVNGEKVTRCVIRNGDRITVGSHVLVFESGIDDPDWVPDHVIDLSSQAGQQTFRRRNPQDATRHEGNG